MEILYIAPSLPNDFSRVRSKNIIKALKNKGCNITLISLYSSKKIWYIWKKRNKWWTKLFYLSNQRLFL